MKKFFAINDPVHSRMVLTEIERSVVDHPIFQRLRRVKALGLLEKVFPSARHSRFEHSIGACYVTGRVLTSIIQNQNEISGQHQWKNASDYTQWHELEEFLTTQRQQQIKLAALLHDVGHGPFSHASEDIMPLREELISSNKTDLPAYIENALLRRTKNLIQENKEHPERADHEDFSLLLAWKILTEVKNDHGEINDDYIRDVLAFKFELVGPSNSKNSESFQLFKSFVDGDFDGDRMDYLLRDSHYCGVPYGKYDMERLLEGLYILKIKASQKLVLGLKKSSLSAFEDFLFARFQMHSQIYSHRVDGSFNTAFTTLMSLNGCKLPSKIESYAEIDDERLLSSKHFKSLPIKELEDLLLGRKKWKLLYETKTEEDIRPQKLLKRIEDSYGKGFCSYYVSDRPLRKPKVLCIPVVQIDREGELYTEKLEEIALMLPKFNSKFYVQRVFVHPDKFDDVNKNLKQELVPEIVTAPKIEKTASDVNKLEKVVQKNEQELKVSNDTKSGS